MKCLPVFVAFLVGLVACRGSGDRPFRPPETSATHADAKEGGGDTEFMKRPKAPSDAQADQTGLATWYGGAFVGKKTASGEAFDPAKLTAAHRSLPFGTWVEVRRVDTGRTVRVRINDRGPFGDAKRVIDVSRKAAEDLELVRDGIARVELRVVDGP
jgi:rare lipoprotein A